MSKFIHLHNHTHYSLLDAACTPLQLIEAAERDGMPSLAITDHGVMYGCYEFYKKCTMHGIKPLLGFEAYMALGSRFNKNLDKIARTSKQNYYHLILIAKDFAGYHNLMKLCTIGHTEGFYYRPRIDREVLEKYKDGLIATSACLAGPVSRNIVIGNLSEAKRQAEYYRDLFGEDFYIEIQNHFLPDDPAVLREAPKIAAELGIKVIATNDIHYEKKEHALAHNILLHINKDNAFETEDLTKLQYGTPEFYFKTQDEMSALFKDYPDAIENTNEVADKCDIKLEKKLFMPQFPIPKESAAKSPDDYFIELVRKGFAERYPDAPEEYKKRLEYEIDVIVKMGFPGYFLIVQDYINAAKFSLGVSVGPGRGSAAGSMVAYCLKITNIDPMKYDLLFERFLNPDRVSMPDIDVDFADTTRYRVIDYVKQQYGADSVAQIITFGKLSCKAVLKDVGRVLGIDHTVINKITANIPTFQGKVASLSDALELPDLKEFKEDKDPKMIKLKEYALLLEGLYRNSGVHAAGVAIAPTACSDYVPLVKKEGELVAQFTMKDIEDAGLVKMDFLGLRTLTILDDTLELIEQNYHEKIDLDAIDFSDPATYHLFEVGDTLAVFQFESKGMQEYLMQLKPKTLEEITAMNALYRPGPMENIPEYIDRKNGKKQIEYLHPLMAKTLENTYGIIVYQEQVMQLVQVIAGFTLGQADILRRAMGKKDTALMEKQREKFIEGALKNNVDEKTSQAIFDLIQKFAKYGFNKSHSLAYSYLAFQTAWLKVHYTAEFLAANMTAEKNNQDKVVQLIEEAKAKGIDVLPPDVNHSIGKFNVADNKIYFGMTAIKNVGEGPVESILKARKEKLFASYFDFVARVDAGQLNRRVLEALICSGAFDSLNPHRAALFETIDGALTYAKNMQSVNYSEDNLFGDIDTVSVKEPKLQEVADWSNKVILEKEKEFLNFYVSGHPLNEYKPFISALTNLNVADTESRLIGQKVHVCGLISSINTRRDKNNNMFAFVMLENYDGKIECSVWSRTFAKYQHLIIENSPVMISGKAEMDNDKIKITADEILSLDQAIETFGKGYKIALNDTENDLYKIDELSTMSEKNIPAVKMIFSIASSSSGKNKIYAGEAPLSLSENCFKAITKIFGKNKVELIGINRL